MHHLELTCAKITLEHQVIIFNDSKGIGDGQEGQELSYITAVCLFQSQAGHFRDNFCEHVFFGIHPKIVKILLKFFHQTCVIFFYFIGLIMIDNNENQMDPGTAYYGTILQCLLVAFNFHYCQS